MANEPQTIAEPRAIPFKPESVTLFVGVDGTPGTLTDAEMQRDPSILADFHLWWQLCLLRHGLVEFEYRVEFH